MNSTHPNSRDSGINVLLFGPQALTSSEESLKTLRLALTESESCQWILETISELPSHWKTLTSKIPQLLEIPGEKLLNELHRWFEHGFDDEATLQLPNILLTPLVVLTQLTQYSRYLSLSLPTPENAKDLQAAFVQRNVETVGFCTGLLSASAVSSSSNQAEFERYGAVALRLAVLVGGLVDAQDVSNRLHGRSKSYATAWNSPAMAEEMGRILDCFPEVCQITVW